MQKLKSGKKGGLLKGKPHYDAKGKPLGGIKAVVGGSKKPIELEGGEVIINKEASAENWRELSRINQSAGGGVAIAPPSETDSDPAIFYAGGRTVEFSANETPVLLTLRYAKKIKEQYPAIWNLHANNYGNEAFENLQRVATRGYWLKNEEWMQAKWKVFKENHKNDPITLASALQNLKWMNLTMANSKAIRAVLQGEIKKSNPAKKVGRPQKIEEVVYPMYTRKQNVKRKRRTERLQEKQQEYIYARKLAKGGKLKHLGTGIIAGKAGTGKTVTLPTPPPIHPAAPTDFTAAMQKYATTSSYVLKEQDYNTYARNIIENFDAALSTTGGKTKSMLKKMLSSFT